MPKKSFYRNKNKKCVTETKSNKEQDSGLLLEKALQGILDSEVDSCNLFDSSIREDTSQSKSIISNSQKSVRFCEPDTSSGRKRRYCKAEVTASASTGKRFKVSRGTRSSEGKTLRAKDNTASTDTSEGGNMLACNQEGIRSCLTRTDHESRRCQSGSSLDLGEPSVLALNGSQKVKNTPHSTPISGVNFHNSKLKSDQKNLSSKKKGETVKSGLKTTSENIHRKMKNVSGEIINDCNPLTTSAVESGSRGEKFVSWRSKTQIPLSTSSNESGGSCNSESSGVSMNPGSLVRDSTSEGSPVSAEDGTPPSEHKQSSSAGYNPFLIKNRGGCNSVDASEDKRLSMIPSIKFCTPKSQSVTCNDSQNSRSDGTLRKSVANKEDTTKLASFGPENKDSIIYCNRSITFSTSESSNSSFDCTKFFLDAKKSVSFSDNVKYIGDTSKSKAKRGRGESVLTRKETRSLWSCMGENSSVSASEEEIQMINNIGYETIKKVFHMSFDNLRNFKTYCENNNRIDLWNKFKSTQIYEICILLAHADTLYGQDTGQQKGEGGATSESTRHKTSTSGSSQDTSTSLTQINSFHYFF